MITILTFLAAVALTYFYVVHIILGKDTTINMACRDFEDPSLRTSVITEGQRAALRFLCDLLRAYPELADDINDTRIRAWWDNHLAHDAAAANMREKAARDLALKTSAAAKLTADERRALGL